MKCSIPRPRRDFTMYDSVTVGEIPHHPAAVAGYLDGLYANYNEMVRAFPRAKHLSIAVRSEVDAHCLDVEAGDASPAQASGWVIRQHHRGISRPVLYASLDNIPTIVYYLERAGIHRNQVLIWSAHYTGQAHICNRISCGWGLIDADATQWTDRALGRNLDQSLCAPGFL